MTKMSFTLQRYEFFSKSQQWSNIALQAARCRLPCKGTNFLANHNISEDWLLSEMMSFTLQRYEFFSKSQRALRRYRRGNGCRLPCKGTNFLANHNFQGDERTIRYDVVYLAKVRIF